MDGWVRVALDIHTHSIASPQYLKYLQLHMWAPDLYEGSPTLVSAFVSIAPKISLFSNLLNTLHRLDGTTSQQIFFIRSIAPMILGALAAMAQTKVKRPLAHSSVGHVGYLRLSR